MEHSSDKKRQVSCLGFVLNAQAKTAQEINNTMSEVYITFESYNICAEQVIALLDNKLMIHDAVMKSKLCLGFAPAHMNDSITANIDAFQLKGIRQTVKISVAYSQHIQEVNK